MITEAIINFFTGLLSGFLDLLPGVPAPVKAEFDALPGQVQSVVDTVVKLNPIVPLDQVEVALRIWVGCLSVAFTIAVVGKAISLFSGGGGK